MYTPLHGALLPAHILFLSRREPRVRTDTSLLRSIGVPGITHLTQTAAALALLRDRLAPGSAHDPRNAVDMLVCDEYTEDGPAFDVVRALAEDPALQGFPLVVISGDPAQAAALQKGSVNVLERPYTLKQLNDVLRRAISPMRARLRADALDAAAPGTPPPAGKKRARPGQHSPQTPRSESDLFRKGMEYLRNGNPAKAEDLLRQVLDRQEDHLEACLALVRVQHSQGQTKAMQHSLLRAAAICLRKGDKERAAAIAAHLPPHMRGEKLLVHAATARMEEGEYKAAALGFLDASRELPGTALHSMLARAAVFTPRPEENMHKLCNAFESMGHGSTASKLRQRLLDNPPPREQLTANWLDNYPRLQEILSVASYTTWAWRQA